MILVDTSVLIDFLKGVNNTATEKFEQILEINTPFGITSHVYQELLQGAATRKDFNSLKKYLETFTFYHPASKKESYAAAAGIYFKCRKNGITVRSSIDCIIVQITIEHNLLLLHNDRDFVNIKRVIPQLKQY